MNPTPRKSSEELTAKLNAHAHKFWPAWFRIIGGAWIKQNNIEIKEATHHDKVSPTP